MRNEIVARIEANAELKKALKGILQFDLGDEKYFVTVGEKVTVTEGKNEKADIVFTTTPALLRDLLDGRVNAQMAYYDNRLKLKGAQAFAVLLFRTGS